MVSTIGEGQEKHRVVTDDKVIERGNRGLRTVSGEKKNGETGFPHAVHELMMKIQASYVLG